jgi:ABC-type transport system involved in cytochrome c biogenesis permease subunit
LILGVSLSGLEILRSFARPEVSPLLKAAAPACVLSLIFYALGVTRASNRLRVLGLALAAGAVALVLAAQGTRWAGLGTPPLNSMYEVFIATAAAIGLVSLAYDLALRARVVALLGLGALAIFLCLALAVEEKDPLPLKPVLQSWWFFPHVTAYMLGYAAMLIAGVLGLVYLAVPWLVFAGPRGEPATLADYAHSLIKLGFVFMTAGLLMGALWAKTAWGDYWGWDPKEGWSLATWLIYVVYLHTAARRRRFAAAALNVAGAVAVLVTLAGTAYLPSAAQSLHVYAGMGSEALVVIMLAVLPVAVYVAVMWAVGWARVRRTGSSHQPRA